MLKTILKRILQSIPTLFIVITITFVLTRMIPGNPALTMLGPQAPKESVEQLEQELGLDKSKGEQYIMYLKQILSGDFGRSYSYNQSVVELIMERVPNTLVITLTSLFIALILGMIVGIVSAVRQYSILDYIFMVLALIGVSMPIFWMGLMLVLLFSVNLGWLPAMGMGDPANGMWDVISHMILPCFCLATIPMATFARITRSSMLEVVNSDSVKALRARGLKEGVVIWKHALKNALPPIVTVLGLQLATAFTGAILTESIFSWPGMGTMIVSAIDNRDYALIQGVVLFTAIVFVVINLIVDVVYTIINPKVNYESGNGGR
ncbi:ABC transporter permease [Blautia sp. An46]|uniref:ABC transporter permease n=1 Tax=Blautia sp. An46 TaxID=1965636 RepID=UPI000B3929F1|nr:ABC transporter permease [Blautia sp. An46]OUN92742.1 glutathione ABC transporter permease GsiC [Blautia sp. An46]HJD37939.1 ABC transporter permease [Candidatus Blautia ornithocaccae]